MEAKYAKGEKPRDLDAAKGGLVLARLRSFCKSEDGAHDDLLPLGTGQYGPENEPNYAKGSGPDKQAIRKGETKSQPVIKPRK